MRTIHVIIVSLLVVFLAGCTNETNYIPENKVSLITISTRGSDAGDISERVVKTLRLMLFDSSTGKLTYSKLYSGVSLSNSLSAENGEYVIKEWVALKNTSQRVCLVANEPAGFTVKFNASSPAMTYQALNLLEIEYDQDYNFVMNNGNIDNLNLYTSSDADHIMMYGESLVDIDGDDVDAGTISLSRTIAKVTLTLKYSKNIQEVNYPDGEDFVLKSAAIMSQPLSSSLINSGSKPYLRDDFLPTELLPLSSTGVVNPTHVEMTPIVFYIPEYYLSQIDAYTYIEVLGEITKGGVKKQTVVYKIPLGEGVQKLYDSNPGNDNLVIDDYSVVRNHHYVVNGTINSMGELDGILLELKIKDWQNGDDISVENNSPYLNVSDIALNRTLTPAENTARDTVFFWSNQPQSQISLAPTVEGGGLPYTLVYYTGGGVAMTPTSPLLAVDVSMHKNQPGDPGFFDNNGNVKIEVGAPLVPWDWQRAVVSFYIKAGNLKRRVTITYEKG